MEPCLNHFLRTVRKHNSGYFAPVPMFVPQWDSDASEQVYSKWVLVARED